nr:YdaS family helix-turn-helix protein [uncultured Roseococcus sp.]
MSVDIQSLIKASGHRQVAIAEAMGVSEPTLSRWARCGVPPERLAEFSRLTGISASELRPDLAAMFAPASGRAAPSQTPAQPNEAA